MLFSLSVPAFAGTKEAVHISVSGRQLDRDAIEKENTIFLPLRSVCEGMGYQVEWSGENRAVTVKTAEKTVQFEFKTGTITDGGHNYYVLRDYVSDAYSGSGCMNIGGRIYAASDLVESCFGLTKTFDEKQNAFVLSLSPKGIVTYENKKIYSDDQKLLTNIQYPHFSMTDKAVAEKLNAVIMADVNTAQKEAQDNLKFYEGSESPNRYETYFNYRIVYQKGDILSVVLNDYQYYGGAHGSDRQISHTFDLKTGVEYSLADLMKSGSGYQDYINKCVKADIVKDGLEDAQLVKFESIADDQSYYLSDKGLVVYFQQYEYFPYAAGIVEFTLPYADLAEYLKPDFQSLGTAN
jgi:inhibitor of cysteine peptidase